MTTLLQLGVSSIFLYLIFFRVPGCSGTVPECSEMFHVPCFIDGHLREQEVCLFGRFCNRSKDNMNITSRMYNKETK